MPGSATTDRFPRVMARLTTEGTEIAKDAEDSDDALTRGTSVLRDLRGLRDLRDYACLATSTGHLLPDDAEPCRSAITRTAVESYHCQSCPICLSPTTNGLAHNVRGNRSARGMRDGGQVNGAGQRGQVGSCRAKAKHAPKPTSR
jgi:hypothetical protein